MLIVYDTMTGNTRKFVNKLPFQNCHISEYDGVSSFILVTYTINFGKVPKTTSEFMKEHYGNCLGVGSSGNKNWGGFFGNAASELSMRYNVPTILKFELQGTKEDVKNFIERANEIVRVD